MRLYAKIENPNMVSYYSGFIDWAKVKLIKKSEVYFENGNKAPIHYLIFKVIKE